MPIALLFAALLPTAKPAADLFTAKVRPILAAHCFKCHGPDDKVRKAKLRLDVRDSAKRVFGKPGESELLRRISSPDESVMMPPPHAKLPLDVREKAILKQWIEQGAPYSEHWAFIAPRRPSIPTGTSPVARSTVRNPIDAFILARLEKEGLRPSPEAGRATLVRRVSLDLVGLPPTPEEADAFINDPAPDAYERLVQRLLASPRYGERWARRWLDLARYADTNGYEKDRQRSVWPYRDWVINALNADMPFDRFTLEQLAGDMIGKDEGRKMKDEKQPGSDSGSSFILHPSSLDPRIATGFHRNTMLNEEGGIDPLEFRFHAMTDRVATTATVWLGLTLGCAQCHAHKFDPIPHRDYYRFMALLNNADEPTVDVHAPEVESRRRQIQARIDQLLAELPRKLPQKALDAQFADWLRQERARTAPWAVMRPVEATSNLPLLTPQADDSIFVSGDQTKSDTYRLKFRLAQAGVTALRLEALPDERLPQHGPGRTYYEGPFGDFTLCEFTATANGKPVKVARATASFASGGFTADKAIDGHPQTGWSIAGGQGRAHCAVFHLAEPLPAGEVEVTMLFERHFCAGLGRFRLSATSAAKPADARDMPNELEALLLVPDEKLTAVQRDRLHGHFIASTPALAKQRQEIDALRKQLPAYPTTLVMQERPPENQRPTFVYHRGEFLQPAERVEPGVLSVLENHGDKPRDSLTRLDLARWLVAPENPLTARVTVNRHWSSFFGTGIVSTVQDFGYTGAAPTHPELLDWLATEFIRQQWSVKRLHYLIVTSATYRQSSQVRNGEWGVRNAETPHSALRTPHLEDRLLSRGPRVRLEAEMIRDSVLRVSGLMSQKMLGPSVFPPQPANVSTEGAYGQLAWRVSTGEDRYRRGLYTFMKRTAPFAMAATFDGPSGEFCIARREVSNTPLQALTMLNDVAITEAAQALGREFAAKPGAAAERIEQLFRRCLTRRPTVAEAAALLRFHEAQEKRFAVDAAGATRFAGPGDNASKRAAWTALARALFNLDEMIVKE